MAGQGSARVTLREIDLSQVRNPQQSPQGVPAAVVGTARKGPAFVPRTFANMQQFNEVFGSMLEVGKDSNSNLPGPLALNEWMRSAQAGTFLRVLGVGDGTKAITGTTNASLGKVPEAGFVVGQELVQARSGSNSAGKVSKNPKAKITESTADRSNASAAAKTHFLGCFMKDASGSSFLKDAGIETDSAAASTTLTLSDTQINNDSFFILQGYDANGGSKFFKIIFKTNTDAISFAEALDAQKTGIDVSNAKEITVGIDTADGANNAGNRLALLEDIKKALEGKNEAGADQSAGQLNNETQSNPATYFTVNNVTDDTGTARSINITQVGAGIQGNSAQIVVNVTTTGNAGTEFTFTSGDDTPVTTSNSSDNQTVQMTLGAENASARSDKLTVVNKPTVIQPAKTTITVTGVPADEETFVITDGTFSQTFKFLLLQDAVSTLNGGIIEIGLGNGSGGTVADVNEIADRIWNSIDDARDTTIASPIVNNVVLSADPQQGADNFTVETVDDVRVDIVQGSNSTTVATNISEEQNQQGGVANDAFTITDIFGNISTFTFNPNSNANARLGNNTYTVGIQTPSQTAQSAAVNDAIATKIQGAIQDLAKDHAADEANETDSAITQLNATKSGVEVTVTNSLNGQSAAIIAETVQEVAGDITIATVAAGSAGSDESQVTLTFTSSPEIGHNITIPTISTSNGSTRNVRVLVVADAGGTVNGIFTNTDDLQVEHHANVDIFAARLQSAFETNADLKNIYTVTLSDTSAGASVIIKRNLNAAHGYIMNQTVTFNLNSEVIVTGASPVTGNLGQKTGSFGGGGGGASPIIRGVLMMPQGVKPSMQVNSSLATFSKSTTNTDLRNLEIHGKTFGSVDATNLAGYLVGKVDSSQSFNLLLNGFTNLEESSVIKCSFDPDDDSYFAKVLNTDPTKIEEKGHYLYAHWDIDSNVAVPSKAGVLHAGSQLSGDYDNMIGFVMAGAGDGSASGVGPDYDSFEQRFQTAKTPWIVSQFTSVSSNTLARPATAAAGGAKKLFRLYSLDDGEVGNTQFRLLISDLRYNGANDYGTFTLSLEKFDSDPVRGEILISWKKADLNPDSPNFIGRLIGDEHTYYDFDLDSDKQRLKTKGSYALKNNYVRIELSDEVKQGLIPVDCLPAGFQGHSHLRTVGITNNFVEQSGLAENSIFTDVSGAPLTTLNSAQALPLDYVKSISRLIATSTEEADSDLAWGVKLSVRENKDSDKKELVEQVLNHSVKSWTKFFPELGQSHAFETDGDEADKFQNSFFSLENIELGNASSTAVWNGSKYVRKPAAASNRFVTISQDAKGGNVKYLKFRCLFQGGFDGVNIFDQEKAELTSVASVREGQDETGAKKFTGPTVMSYRRAVDVLADKSAAEFQLLSVPGQRASQVTDYAIDACEDRFDALLVMDVIEKTAETHHVESSSEKPHVRNTISSFEGRSLDTSFAAAYFPDVVIRRPSDSAPVIMPPSVGMMGVMSRNDSIADPWFAPAGLSRGRLGAIDAKVQMNRDLLDELYDADINPIYVPAGRSGEVYAFGQKTLLQDASALDRINVRRLLIDIRRKVKKVGEELLFEPNRASTLTKFSALVEPIMANVQQRRGVERYKVQIDTTTTTQNDVENNTIRGKIYLQPTKSVEFISLDFVVANNIQ